MDKQQHYKTIAKAIRFIRSNYQAQPNLDELAEHVHLSKYHFQRLFQEWAGVSPKQFLQLTTVAHAKQCLVAGRSTLDTAYEVGLTGNGRLHDLFVKVEACTPGEFKKRGKGLDINYEIMDTPFGKTLVAETSKGLCKLSFLADNDDPVGLLVSDFPEAKLQRKLGNNAMLAKSYFDNWQVPSQQIMLDLRGTPFQLKVWRALLAIPAATLLSYGDIAQQINQPKAVRAVGTAIGKNPIAYLIPCHRVIRETGQLGGYRWGLDRKLAINGFETASQL